MSNAASHPPAGPNRALEAAVGISRRLWSLLLIAVVLWLSYRAIRYLFDALLQPAAAPAQIVALPLRTSEELRAPAFAGVSAVENPRSPLGHYHRIENWFQPDRFNGCIRSGCHTPLPHGRNKADRAFLNMHATSLHCGVCHLQTDQQPLPLVWYDLHSGGPTAPPVLLRAYDWLIKARDKAEFTPAEQTEIVALLRAALAAGGDDPGLRHVTEQLAAIRADAEDFPRLVATAADLVPRSFRGEYGAKLALAAEGRPRLNHPDNEAAIREFLKRKDSLAGAARDELLQKVHPARRTPTLTCSSCHTPTGGLVDLAKVGYPPARVAALVQPLITQAIEHMMEGREFHMPTMLPPGRAPAEQPGGAP
jgi:hypothetical protein